MRYRVSQFIMKSIRVLSRVSLCLLGFFAIYYTASASLCDTTVTPWICGDYPSISLSASPNPVNFQNSSTLSWTLLNVNSGECTSSGWVWPGTMSGTLPTGNLSNSTTYTLSCTNYFGSASKSVLVTVNTIPATIDTCTYGLASNPSLKHSPDESAGRILAGEDIVFSLTYTPGAGGPAG